MVPLRATQHLRASNPERGGATSADREIEVKNHIDAVHGNLRFSVTPSRAYCRRLQRNRSVPSAKTYKYRSSIEKRIAERSSARRFEKAVFPDPKKP